MGVIITFINENFLNNNKVPSLLIFSFHSFVDSIKIPTNLLET